MRTLVIGDIHGNAKGLQQVLERCGWNTEEDKIIQLGDVADGWSETSECVDILLDIKEKSVNKPVFIRGNHDVWVHDWINMGLSPIIWTEQGGKATLANYVATGKFLEQDHKDFWLKDQVDWFIDDENRIFIHAGWDYKSADFPESANYRVNAGDIARECHWDRSLLKNAAAVEIFRAKGVDDYNKKVVRALEQFKEVYIGHTATSSHEVENFVNLWNLDSGSGWYGRLAIMDVDTKEIWYSDYSKELYPDEKGR